MALGLICDEIKHLMQDARVAKLRDVQHIGRREENGSGEGEEGKVASLLLYRKKWADLGEAEGRHWLL